jgi:hypothetical protein
MRMRMPGDVVRLAMSSSPAPFHVRCCRLEQTSWTLFFDRWADSTDSQSRVVRAENSCLVHGRKTLSATLLD